jgi:hypothetical protein
LVYDQMACSKLYRRTFWDGTALRFPEGVLYEDVALVMRAHCSAETVDLIASPTYRWRRRESGTLSITQDRYRAGSVSARFAALAAADSYLREHAPASVWEEHGVKIMTIDVRLYSRLLVEGDDRFMEEFMTGAGGLVESMSPSAVERLSPVMREVRRALLAGDGELVVDCTRFYTGDDRRGTRELVADGYTLIRNSPSSFGRIILGEIRRGLGAIATRAASSMRRFRSIRC